MDRLYRSYLNASVLDNWKFYLFNFMMKPLFETYKEEVSTDSAELFRASVEDWTDSRLSLSSLRHQTLENMRDITRQTDIMSNPASLPKQALASISHLSNSPTSAPSSNTSHLSTPVDSALSSDIPRLSTSVSSASTSSNMPHLSALVSSSTPSSSQFLHMPASKSSLPPFTSSNSFCSLPTLSLSSLSPAFTVPRRNVQQNLTSQFSASACKPTTCTEDKARVRNHHRPSTPASTSTASTSRKRTSGLTSTGTLSERGADESMPVVRKRESIDRPTAQLPFGPLSMFVPARHTPVEHQLVGTLQIDMNDIGQLAASVEETSLHMNPPVAVVTPTTALNPPITVVIPTQSLQQQLPLTTSMAHLISDSQCQEYDFDLTDIPLPDL